MAKYLNLAGLQTLWAKAKNTFVPKTRKINDKELSSDVNLVLGDIVPIVSKTFSNVIGSVADQANSNFFFGKLTPSDKSVYVQCRARYRLYAWIHDASKIPSTDTNKTNNVYTRGWFDVEINVRGETLVVYKVWNNHSSTSYKTISYHELGRAKSATIQAGGGHILGVRTRDAYSPIATGWNRDYRIDILELENCTFEFFDEMKKHSVAYTSDFVALSEIDGTNNGLRESGDDNDTSTICSASTGYVVGINGMQQYSLCAIDKDGKLQSFTKTAGTGTTKTVNDAKFKFPLVLYRYNQSTNRSNGYYFEDNWIQKIVASFDARYSCNRGTVFNSNAGPVYLEGTIDDDGYFSVSSNILTQTFSEGKVYVHVGNPYNASAAATNVYNINLDATHPAYYYDGTNLVPFEDGRYASKSHTHAGTDVTSAVNYSKMQETELLDKTKDIVTEIKKINTRCVKWYRWSETSRPTNAPTNSARCLMQAIVQYENGTRITLVAYPQDTSEYYYIAHYAGIAATTITWRTVYTVPTSTYSATGTRAVNGTAVASAIRGKANAASVTGATKCKVTYNSQGVIIAGTDLAASDIPNLATSKITSGTFADERIASASKWNAKQDALTFDTTPTENSSNPVTSAGVKSYVDSAVTGLYKYRGSVNTDYINALQSPSNGDVYNINTSGTITNGEGGQPMSVLAGDNVAFVLDPITSTTYWDKMSSELDLSNFVDFDDIATATTAGVVKSSSTNGKVSVDASGVMTVNGWSGKQNSLASQTAYTSKGSATKVPQITTNSLGQVTGITEVTITNTEYAVPDATTLASITDDLR